MSGDTALLEVRDLTVHHGQLRALSEVSLSVFPGAAIMLAVLGFNFAGDGLRDLLDPRLRGV